MDTAEVKTKLTGYELIEVLEENDLEVRSYSGRGMNGADCVAFTMDDSETKLLTIGAELVMSVYDDDMKREKLIRAFGNARIDNMGRDSIVVYFPAYKWPE